MTSATGGKAQGYPNAYRVFVTAGRINIDREFVPPTLPFLYPAKPDHSMRNSYWEFKARPKV